jgi:NAD(P)-dependent dehydrogenase (short-subunit alcohol dehydrogenase family)
MDRQLKDKVVIVTGGAKGIGTAIVHVCAAEGAIPVIVDRDVAAGEKLQKDSRRPAHSRPLQQNLLAGGFSLRSLREHFYSVREGTLSNSFNLYPQRFTGKLL